MGPATLFVICLQPTCSFAKKDQKGVLPRLGKRLGVTIGLGSVLTFGSFLHPKHIKIGSKKEDQEVLEDGSAITVLG